MRWSRNARRVNNTKNPEKSEIIVSAREKEAVDINFMNYLSNINQDFYTLIRH